MAKGAVGTSAGFGVSTFFFSVLFIGFDPENLAVGAVGSYEAASGIALGSIIGAAMVAIAFAFGVTALIVPMDFARPPRSILAIPVLAVLLFGGLAWDGSLSRLDGGILLLGFVLAALGLLWMSRQGMTSSRKAKSRKRRKSKERLGKWKSVGVLVLSLAAIVVGSEMLVTGSKVIIDRLELSETFFGMTILAFLVSIEEIARELPAALKGRPEISFGNVVGSILAFFCFNTGIIALVRPVVVERPVTHFYVPVCAIAALITTAAMLTRRVPRWLGAILVLLYVAFVIGGYISGGFPTTDLQQSATASR